MPVGVFASLSHEDVPLRVRTRFVEYLAPVVGDEDGCWLWPLSTASHGYGQIGWSGKDEGRGLILAHRLSYLIFHGPIPEGMTVDHVCRTRQCVNPAHLRLLTNIENARNNGASIRTHCPQGHAYDGENTRLTSKGHRKCIACHKARRRAA